MNRLAFLMLFLYIRSFKIEKYSKDFNSGKRDSEPNRNAEFDQNNFNRKQEEKVFQNLHKLESNYFLERQTFW